MDYSKGQGSFSSQYLPGRRSREERRSLSETLADGTSKFFSSMVAKKNGLFTDISNKIENTFAPKTDTISNSTGSDASASPPGTPPGSAAPTQNTPPPQPSHPFTSPQSSTTTSVPNTPPPRPPPPKRLPSMGSSQERTTTVIKRMSSMPAYSRTESRGESDYVPIPPTGRGTSSFKDDGYNNRYNIGGMNVSFDQPIYGHQQQRDSLDKEKANVTDTNKVIPRSAMSKSETEESEKSTNQHNKRITSNATAVNKQPVNSVSAAPNGGNNSNKPEHPSNFSTSSMSQPVPAPRSSPRSPANNAINNNANNTGSNNTSPSPTRGNSNDREERYSDHVFDKKPQNLRRDMNQSSSSGEWSDRRQTSEDSNKSCPNERYSDSSGNGGQQVRKKNPKLTTARRSSTVDEMLFDDYVDPEIDAVLPPSDTPPENLISFEPDIEVTRSDSSGSDGGHGGSRGMLGGASVDSSDVEYGGVVPRSGSVGSDKSWSSSYSVDSQPDDLTLDCMEFMKSFVDKVFLNGEEISQTDKAKFGELCQHFPGRLWFSRYVNSQRVHNKCVNEPIFFRLMQYFAVCLFECNEAEDYSPAKTLMNMCFTFFYEAPSPNGAHSPTGGGQSEKVFLYTYMREQPIWQSLRFWNAAFFDAVQCERSRKPMPTNSAENQTVTDDRQFQENITFGQLGTFACNMRSFGLSKELCLEFLRKQSTIANLRKDQVKLLRDNIERVREN